MPRDPTEDAGRLAVADIVEAITYLNDRNPTATANLDADIARCIKRGVASQIVAADRSHALGVDRRSVVRAIHPYG